MDENVMVIQQAMKQGTNTVHVQALTGRCCSQNICFILVLPKTYASFKLVLSKRMLSKIILPKLVLSKLVLSKLVHSKLVLPKLVISKLVLPQLVHSKLVLPTMICPFNLFIQNLCSQQ